MKITTMKFFGDILFLLFICGNLSSQNTVNRTKTRVHSIMDDAFRNSINIAHNPLVATSPYSKVTKAEKQRYQLDSLILTPGAGNISSPKGKIECKYDSLGRMILFYCLQSNDTTKELVFSYKYVYRYGSNYMIRDEYNSDNGPVSFHMRTKTTYDQNNNIQTIIESADTANLENNSTKIEYIYKNNLLSVKNTISQSLALPLYSTRYYYDALNRDTAEVTFNNYIGNDTLLAYTKQTYTYDMNNDIIHSETNYYNKTNWNPDSKSDYIYNNSHDCISYKEKSMYIDSTSNYQQNYITSYNKSIMMSDINYGYTFADFPYSFKSQIENIDLSMNIGSNSLLVGTYSFYYSKAK